jgi:hypothetical protein
MLSLVVGTLVVLGSSSVSAQEATPAAASDRTQFVVPASECVISTLLPGVLNSLATPTTDAATPAAAAASDTPFAVPAGTPADAETATAVTAIFRQSVACLNGGNLSRYFSLLTEGELRERFTAEDVAAAVAVPPMPVPDEEQTALYAILGVTILDDGRAGAYVIVDTVANPDPVEVTYMIAAETDAGWRIDDIITFAADGSAA